jgi:hypothetical protein
MSVSGDRVIVSEGSSKGTPTLMLVGTDKGDVINITDNGTGQPGNVTVTLGNGSVYRTKSGVQEIEVMTRGANAQVSYTLNGSLVAPQTVLTYLGPGTDTYTANVNGNVDNSAGLDLETYGGSGNDTMTINQSGQITEGTFIPFMEGGRGNDVMTYNGTGPINADATINPAIAAGRGNDTMTTNYSGTIDGNYAYNMTVKGGRGTNNITDKINVGPDSTGIVGTSDSIPALIMAGPGKSKIMYAITVDPTASQAHVYAAIAGATSKDTVERTGNVVEDSKIPSDFVISS